MIRSGSPAGELRFYLKNANTPGNADISFVYGIRGDIPIAGDWTGKGYVTVGVYRPSESRFYLKNTHSSGEADIEFSYGAPGDTPLTGRWRNSRKW